MIHTNATAHAQSAPGLAALFGLTLLLASAGSPVLAEEGSDWKLALESAAAHADRPVPLAHPARLGASELEALLRGLIKGERGFLGRSSQRSVFRADEAGVIAAGLAEYLARATADQQARFAWFSQDGGTLGQLRKTEAVVFVDAQERLNLAFTTIHDFAGPDRDFFEFMALSRQDPFSITRSLVQLVGLPEGMEAVAAAAGDRYPLWVRTTSATLPSVRPVAEPGEQGREVVPAAVQSAAAAAPPPVPVTQPPALGSRQAVRDRLEFLKELYDSGLITEAEYAERRKEALDRLDP